jgi:SAM-dependent methyltransferase
VNAQPSDGSEAPSVAPDVDALVAELQAKVAARRKAGDYPPGLEEDLSQHFERVLSQRAGARPAPDLHGPLQAVGAALPINVGRIQVGSDVPGGKVVHQAIARLVGRQTQGVVQQVQAFAEPVRATLTALVEAVEALAKEVHVDISAHLDAVYERQAAHERALAVAGTGITPVTRTAGDGGLPLAPWLSADRFDEEFRGSRTEILARYEDLAQRLIGSDPVLDLGCGRGEFLELLGRLRVEASGVDVDFELAKAAVERGLRVEHGDGIRALEQRADASLGALVLFQVVEHLSAQQVVDLVALAAEKVRPGGQVLAETVNPQSLYVFAHSFYLDPTHLRPVHPAYLAFLFREAGFASVAIEWRSPPPSLDVLLPSPEGSQAPGGHDENIRRLNQLLFAPQDYLVVATR